MKKIKKSMSIILVGILAVTCGPWATVYAEDLLEQAKQRIYLEDFEDSNLNSPLEWTIHSGSYEIKQNKGDYALYNTGTTELIASMKNFNEEDYEVEMTFNNLIGEAYTGILGRMRDKNNFYIFRMNKFSDGKKLELAKNYNGTMTTLASNTTYMLKSDTEYVFKMKFKGNNIKCYINEELIFDINDNTFSKGSIGIRNKWNKIYVDDVNIVIDQETTKHTITTDTTHNAINLAWDQVEGAQAYEVLRLEGREGKYINVATVQDNTYVDIGLDEQTDYHYKIITKGLGEEVVFGPIKVSTTKFDMTESNLSQLVEEAKQINTTGYTQASIDNLNMAIQKAQEILSNVGQNSTDVLEETYNQLKETIGYLTLIKNSITSGTTWVDTEGKRIQAHGGGIWYDSINKIYYWYGEDKTNGKLPLRGVRCYSSKDLYNWEDEGLALKAIGALDDFETDEQLKEVYKDCTMEEKQVIYEALDKDVAVLERPKVIYNEKTNKWVMWLHADGPIVEGGSRYAKAQAGVAISDSPTGPFEYISSYRLDEYPGGYPSNPGMARDMNLFVDDDGTGYIIYASEQNASLYISRLTDDYLDITGWNKEGKVDEKGRPIRDGVYQGEVGEDFIRIFPNISREAPAMFKYDGLYYLITSGCTGWAPNQAKYAVADQVFGTWIDKGDPCVGDTNKTTFDSQSTYVIPVNEEEGKFIFMGDRWKESDLADSRYIWLPIQFNNDGVISIKWYDEWTTDTLDTMGKKEILTELPQYTSYGVIPDMPEEIVIIQGGIQKTVQVEWTMNEDTFTQVGQVGIEGKLSTGESINTQIYVIPDNVRYFVNCGLDTPDYNTIKGYITEGLLNNEVHDQAYDGTWGYKGASIIRQNTTNIYESLRYPSSDNSTRTMNYTFSNLEQGKYNVYIGMYDPWYQYSNGKRKVNIDINGECVDENIVINNQYNTYLYSDIEVKEELSINLVPTATGTDTDPQVSWIIISEVKNEENDIPMGILTGESIVNVEDIFEVYYSLNTKEAVYAQIAKLDYDKNSLEVVEIIPLINKEKMEIIRDKESEKIAIAHLGQDNGLVGKQEVFKVMFKALAPGQQMIGLTGEVSDGEAIYLIQASKSVSVQSILPSVDKTLLQSIILEAQELLNNTTEGIYPGQFLPEIKVQLAQAIATAQGIYNDDAVSQDEVNRASDQLSVAINVFRQAINPNEDVNEDGKCDVADLAIIAYYYLKTTSNDNWEVIKRADICRDGVINIQDLSYVANRILENK